MTIHYEDESVVLHHGDCIEVMRTLPDNSVDSVVCDPPYGLEFMGKGWDGADGFRRSLNANDSGRDDAFGRASRTSPEYRAGALFQEWCELWTAECLRVLKPGGHLLAFGGTRTWHRLACAVEDAGFEVRDSIAWLYGQGFPKSLNVSTALDAVRCRCPVREWTYGTEGPDAEPQAEHSLRDVPSADVPATEGTPRRAGALLLPSLSESGTPAAGRAELRPAEDGCGEPRMERRGDLPQGEGELHRAEVRPLPCGVPADGPVGRLHHGAPSRDGSVDRSDADPDGVREPQEPRPEGQSAGEPGALPDQRRPQAWGGWPVCRRCSQPVIPDGLGTAAKPSFEPIVVARKPLAGTAAANVLEHGTGALNIDGCRVHGDDVPEGRTRHGGGVVGAGSSYELPDSNGTQPAGRWPANVVLDESQAEALDDMSGTQRDGVAVNRNKDPHAEKPHEVYGGGWMNGDRPDVTFGGTGGASRFFYVAKAGQSERPKVNGTAHPTVKPLDLMRWLVRLVTPPGGTVLEPFAGSGTTVEACVIEGFRCIAIEKTDEYLPLTVARIHRRRDPVAAIKLAGDDLGLFDIEEDIA